MIYKEELIKKISKMPQQEKIEYLTNQLKNLAELQKYYKQQNRYISKCSLYNDKTIKYKIL